MGLGLAYIILANARPPSGGGGELASAILFGGVLNRVEASDTVLGGREGKTCGVKGWERCKLLLLLMNKCGHCPFFG